MATAVSGTGPTYVFLVMEALIDAAVHLGFPRHVAHDLVIETLEGSTLFAKQSGMHPAELRNMVTSPGGTSAAALHELERGRLRTVLSRGGLGGVPAHRRARRPARGAASTPPAPDRRPARPPTDGVPTAHAPTSTSAARRWPTSRAVDFRGRRARPVGRRGRALGSPRARPGPVSTTPPGICPVPRRRTPAGPTGRSPSTSATSPTGRSSPSTTSPVADRDRPLADATTTTTAATSTATTSVAARPGRRCRPRPSSRA